MDLVLQPRVKGGKALARESSTQIGVVGVSTVTAKPKEDAAQATTATSHTPSVTESSQPQPEGGDEQDEHTSIANQLEGMTLEGELGDDSEDEAESLANEEPAPAAGSADSSHDAGEFQQVASSKANTAAKPHRAPIKELADDEGWITPSNIHKASKTLDPFGDVKIDKKPEVACLTTDFAMQVWHARVV